MAEVNTPSEASAELARVVQMLADVACDLRGDSPEFGPYADRLDEIARIADTLSSHDGSVEATGDELAAWRELSDHVRTGVPTWPGRYTDDRTREVAQFIRDHQHGGGGEAVELAMRECPRCGLPHPRPQDAADVWDKAVAKHLGDTAYGPDYTVVLQSVELCIRRTVSMQLADTPPPQPRAEGMVLAFVRDFLAGYDEFEESQWSPQWRELAERARALAAAPGEGSGECECGNFAAGSHAPWCQKVAAQVSASQSAPPSDELPWCKTRSAIINALAAIVRIGGSDKLEALEGIPREPVMREVMRIREALDWHSRHGGGQ